MVYIFSAELSKNICLYISFICDHYHLLFNFSLAKKMTTLKGAAPALCQNQRLQVSTTISTTMGTTIVTTIATTIATTMGTTIETTMVWVIRNL